MNDFPCRREKKNNKAMCKLPTYTRKTLYLCKRKCRRQTYTNTSKSSLLDLMCLLA